MRVEEKYRRSREEKGEEVAVTNEKKTRRKEGVEKEVREQLRREQEGQQQWDSFTNTGPVYMEMFSV